MEDFLRDVAENGDFFDKLIVDMKFFSKCYSKLLREFSAAKTDMERVYAILKYLANQSLLPFSKKKQLASTKSLEKSIELRNAGNKAYINKEKNRALILYAKSIAFAPYPATGEDRSEELAMAFSNRSALLLATKKYKACLEDIAHALMLHYPESLQYKLFERKGKCFQLMGKTNEAAEWFLRAVAILPKATTLSKDKLATVADNLHAQLKRNNSLKPLRPFFRKPSNVNCILSNACCGQSSLSCVRSNMSCVQSNTSCVPVKSYGQNLRVPSASSCVDVELSMELERCLETTRIVTFGNVLLTEKPYANVTIRDEEHADACYTNCDYCQRRYDAMIPCKYCSVVMYCSDICRKVAWEKWHRIECPILEPIVKLGGGAERSSLAIRILLAATKQHGGLRGLYEKTRELDGQIGVQPRIKGFNQAGLYKSDDYTALHHLMSTSERCHLFSMASATIAVCLMNALDVHTTLFTEITPPSDSSMEEPNWRLYAASLLLKYLHTININGSVIHELVKAPGRKVEQLKVGEAVYLTEALINHSCIPNATLTFHDGNTVAVRAILDIEKWEQVTISYSDCHHAAQDYKTRAKQLLHHGITRCRCIACIGCWPMMLDSVAQMYTRCVWLCEICGEPFLLEPITKSSKKSRSKTKRGKNCRALLPTMLQESNDKTCPKCGKILLVEERIAEVNEIIQTFADITKQLESGCRQDCTMEIYGHLKRAIKIVAQPIDLYFMGQIVSQENFKQSGNFYVL